MPLEGVLLGKGSASSANQYIAHLNALIDAMTELSGILETKVESMSKIFTDDEVVSIKVCLKPPPYFML